jgi:pyruvate dehydrogenase E1 component alpha subunit
LAIPDELAVEAFRRMSRIRQFERHLGKLLARGEIPGSVHSSEGQEAVPVGACLAIAADDYATGYHRSHGHPIAKGAPIDRLMAEMLGRRTGVCRGLGGSMHLADFSVGSLGEAAIVGSSLPIATGAALASQLRGDERIALAFFGDGASNTGIFHETLNMASTMSAPVVFLCENNGYAVSVPFSTSCSVDNVADRAAAYGIPGVIVDGQDADAVYDAVSVAAERARAGDGPSIVEAKTYRFTDHALKLGRLSGIRPDDEVAAWMARDPLVLYREVLVAGGRASAEELDEVEAEVAEELANAYAAARQDPMPTMQDLVECMFSDETAHAELTGMTW